MFMNNVFTYANYFMQQLAEGRELDTIKLQKMLFYAQGWKLGRDSQTLFNNDFVAWSTGPVIKELYKTHRGNISIPNNFYEKFPIENILEKDKIILDFILTNYGSYETFRIMDKSKIGPWQTIIYKEKQPFGTIIPKTIIQQHFSQEFTKLEKSIQYNYNF